MSDVFCELCHDGDGHSVFPHYGVGPHICGWRTGKPAIGHSVGAPKAQWPENFIPDAEYGDQDDGRPPLGVWTHCLECGAGMQEHREVQAQIAASKAAASPSQLDGGAQHG